MIDLVVFSSWNQIYITDPFDNCLFNHFSCFFLNHITSLLHLFVKHIDLLHIYVRIVKKLWRFPMKRLKKGDHIRVVSPSSSIESIGGFEANVAAKKKLEALGFRLSFSEHYFENDIFDSAPIASRVADLEAAFANETVDAVLTTIGGFNCNELLPYLDFDLIAQNPKIFCGYSDTTALLNAIYAKTGMQTYMGPA